METNSTKSTLPLIPLDDVVVFPGMNLTLAIDPGAEEEVLLVPRSGEEFAAVGTVARIDERLTLPGGTRATTLEGLHRGVAGAARTDLNGALRIEVTPHEDPTDSDEDSARWSGSTAPSSRRSSSCVRPTTASGPSCARSPSRERSPTPPATPPT